MAQTTSRLALEVDGRTAEQQIQAVRKALEALTEMGLRAGPTVTSVFANISSSSQGMNATNSALRAVQKALEAVAASGAKAGQTLSGASGSLSATGANAAAAEVKIAAARRAMDALNDSSVRATSSLSTAGNAFSVTGRNAASAGGQVGALGGQMNSLAATATRLAGPLLAVFGLSRLTGEVYQAAEAYSTLTNRMKLVTSTAEEVASAQSAVFSIAQSAFQPLTATAELYQRIATNQTELKLSSQDMAGVVGTISKTLAISGASAASANAALIQLGQAFASGVLRGEELNSVMEQAPALAQAIAKGMGRTVGELRRLGAEGKLTADAVVKALQSQQQAVDDLFNKTAVTIGNSLTAFGNSFTQFVGKLDQASGASQAISSRIVNVSKAIDSLTANSESLNTTINVLGATMSGVAAGGVVLLANSIGKTVYAWSAGRVAAIAQAQATFTAAEADAVKTRSTAALALAELNTYRGTILQTVAAGRYAEARLIEAAADARATAAKNALAAASSRLALVGGPLGLVTLAAGAAAAAFFLMRDNTDEATKALDQHGLSAQDVAKKYTELTAAQQRTKRAEWIAEDQQTLKAADAALKTYVDRVQNGSLQGRYAAAGIGSLTGEFQKMIAEVRSGQRDLDSVNQWLASNIDLTKTAENELSKSVEQYTASIQRNKEVGEVLGVVNAQGKDAAKTIDELRAAQNASAEQTKNQVAEWEKYIAKLREQRDLFGANEKAQAAYAAKKMGLNAQQTEEARLISSQIDVLDKYKDAIKEADKTRQQSLRNELVALYTQQQATEDAATAAAKANKAAFDATARAAKENADKVIGEMQRVINKSLNLTSGRNILLMPEQPQQSITGRSMVLPGAPTPKNGVVPRLTPQQQADQAIAQLNATTDPNKGAGKPKTVKEDAGQKLLDEARQRYAVLQQQTREIEAQGSSTKALGTEAKKLIELEYEISNLKQKKTLTASQKQVLAMAELNLAQQKQNAALEKANDLLKEQYENQAKLKAFRENLTSQLDLAREGISNSLTGAGMGDQARQRMLEDLNIRQEYQKELDKLARDYNKQDAPTASQTELYQNETQALRDALAERMAMQQEYYRQEDELRSNWLAGAQSAWENYRDTATNYQQQVGDATRSILDGVTSSIATNIEDLIRGNQDLGDFFKNIALDMADAIIGALVKMAAQWLVYQGVQLLVGSAAQLGAANTMIANAEATSLQAGLAAYASTAAIPVVGPFLAPEAAAIAIGATQPMVGAIAAAALAGAATGGFSEGGYTGPGGKYEPAGMAHKGEVVWSQEDIRNFGGVAAVESLRKGNVTPISAARGGRGGMQQGAASGAQAPVQMNTVVHNYAGAQVETRQNGDMQEIIIRAAEQRIAGNLARGNGPVTKALTGGYGVKRRAG